MRLTFIPPSSPDTCLHAKWIMVSPDRIVENAFLGSDGFNVTGVSIKPTASTVRDLGPGLIMPLLVNAHTHLELSALKGQVDWTRGFEHWVAELIARRADLSADVLASAARGEAMGQHALGTGAVGEISTLGLTREMMADAGLMGIWFQEILGTVFDPDATTARPDDESMVLSASWAGHAPHTTAPDILKKLKAVTTAMGRKFSIHLAESSAESAFIRGDNPEWNAFLLSRGIDASTWPIGNKSPVRYAHDLGILGPDTLAVHLIQTDAEDLDLLAQTRTRVCLCPRSNFNLHGGLPDIPAMLERGLAPAFGTDSLASCDTLSLFDEMAFVRQHYPGLSPKTMITMAGENGARALGLGSRLGRLETGFWAGCLHVALEINCLDDLLERLTTNDF